MIIYPAIDMRGGKVVRLIKGDPRQQTIYGYDPLETARRWQAAGATWIHIVNLDGALDAAAPNWPILRSIADLGVSIQFGGGLRSLDDVARALDAGITRAVLGTLIVENPDLADEVVTRFGPDRIAPALDARNGKVAVRGWQDSSLWSPTELGRKFAQAGIRHALYTDIARDGGLSGVNVRSTRQLADDTGLNVIASGGVASLDDVTRLHALNIAGAVIGQALYKDVFTLEEALSTASQSAKEA